MKHVLVWATMFIVIIGLLLYINSHRSIENTEAPPALVGNELLVTTYTSDGQPTGNILMQVPFVRSLDSTGILSIVIDQNKDGTFADNEVLASYVPVVAHADWRSGYYAKVDHPLEDGMTARVTVDGVVYTVPVRTQTVETGGLLGLASTTDPENAMKGLGIPIAYAHGGGVEISQEGVPDLNQRPGECAPTAAADSLISLVAKHGGKDLIPGDPLDFIENLKRLMNWTPENGVLPDDFVAGKNRWAAHAGVPIRTTKVGDANGTSTIDAIHDALEKGDAVELRIKFADAAATKIVGGHMVTVVGIHEGDGQTYLELNDPYTKDSGTEMVEVRGNQITNYGPWNGITILSWAFVQTWEGHPTGELLDPMSDQEINGIRQSVGDKPMLTVIEYNGKYLPTSQLVVEDETGCGAKHWHAANGVVTATDGTQVPDPGPQCGYGKVADRPSMNIPAPNNND